MQLSSNFFYKISKESFAKRDLSKVMFLLPNYYATTALYESLRHVNDNTTIWLPQVSSIKNFAAQISGCRSASEMDLISILFDVYKEIIETKISYTLLDFYSLGTEILHAFDFIAMSAMDLEAISSAWRDSPQIGLEDFINLNKVYDKKLLSAEMGYEGLIFVKALSVLDQDFFLTESYTRIVAAGFAAFNPIEEKFFRQLASMVNLDFYWDVGDDMLRLEGNKANFFLGQYKNDALYNRDSHDLVAEETCCTNIDIVDAQTKTAQLRVLCTRLSEMTGLANNKRIAVILQNMDLFLPLINSVPCEASSLNIHLNLNLRHTHSYAFLIALLEFYDSQVTLIGEEVVKIDFLEKILSNPILSSDFDVKNFSKIFLKTQNTYINVSLLKKSSTIIDKILDAKRHKNFVEYFFSFYEKLKNLVNNLNFSSLESEALQLIEKKFFEIKNFIEACERTDNLNTFIKEQLRDLTIPISQKGESNIHLLSLENTACLSYDTVFILDATERNLSGYLHKNNFFRKDGNPMDAYASALESEHAYLIYRLLHSAEKIVALYSSSTGELSRYFLQFSYLLPQITTKKIEYPAILLSKKNPIVIEKKMEVMKLLDKFNVMKSPKPIGLSASSLNTYLECSLKFYFKYVENIRPLEKGKKFAQHEIFGTLLHEIMASVYEPFVDPEGMHLVQERGIKKIINALEKTIAFHFKKNFERGLPSDFNHKAGYNVLAGEVMLKYLSGLLHADLDYAPFSILSVETSKHGIFSIEHTVSPDISVRIQSKIDRVDLKGSMIRVIDYKTGTVNNKLASINSCFDRGAKNRNATALQLMLYSWIYHMSEKTKHERIIPCVVSTKNFFTKKNDFNFYLKFGKQYSAIEDIRSVMGELLENLTGTILELFDSTVPFAQTDNREACTMCDFKKICQRF